MEINQNKSDNILTIEPVGRLDSATSGEFQEVLEREFTEGIQKLVIDFSKVDFISSKGLRVLVSTYKSLNGREMEIINTNDAVQEVFRLSGLLKVFTVK